MKKSFLLLSLVMVLALACVSVNAAGFSELVAKWDFVNDCLKPLGEEVAKSISISADVNYTSDVAGKMDLLISAAGTTVGMSTGTPAYRYNPTKAGNVGTATTHSEGAILIKRDALKLAKVQGPFKMVVNYTNDGSSPRALEITVAGKTDVTNIAEKTLGGVKEYTYEGTDAVDVFIGASNEIRIYDLAIYR